MNLSPTATALSSDASRRARWVLLATLLVLLATALFNAWPGLRDEIWIDEAYTLENYANGSLWRPFLVYLNPNNHVLFSALLAGWRMLFGGNDVAWLRLLPLLLFLLSVPATYFAARRLQGSSCALIACLLFVTASVTANHATQLRGYSASWLPFGLMFWSALNINAGDSNRWRIVYAIASMAAVAVLPSNLFLAMIVAAAVALYHAALAMPRTRHEWLGLAMLFIAPFAGLLAYAFIWPGLLAAARIDWSGWNRNILFGQWLTATLVDFVWFLPVPIIGLGWLLRTARNGQGGRQIALARVLLLLVIPSGMIGLIYALPTPPFPRTFVPLLPIWYCLIGLLAGIAIDALNMKWRGAGVAVLLLAIGSAANGMRNQPCGGMSHRQTDVQHHIELCYQYFRHDYHPSRVIEVLQQMQAREPRPIIADYDGVRTLRVVSGGTVDVMHFRDRFAPIRATMGNSMARTDYPIMVVYHRQQVLDWARELALDAGEYRLVEDTGYYKIYSRP